MVGKELLHLLGMERTVGIIKAELSQRWTELFQFKRARDMIHGRSWRFRK